MAIQFKGKDKFRGLFAAIESAGYCAYLRDNEWQVDDATAIQAIIDTYNPLTDLKADKIAATKAEGLARINATFPAIASLDEVAFYAEFWLSIAAGSRAPTVPFKRVIDIYTVTKNAVMAVNAALTAAAVDAVTPVWPA